MREIFHERAPALFVDGGGSAAPDRAIHLSGEEHFSSILTQSPLMEALFRYIGTIAKTRETVLLLGETGTGKELFAHALHRASSMTGDFVAVNVAGLDDALFSDTLFGHERGAFSGAAGSRGGLIRKADNGTLYLDEIGDLGFASQIKLLRLIENHEYYPLGSDRLMKSKTRIAVSTHHDLEDLVKKGTFRDDLYYRLCTHTLRIPPLSCRKEDIPLLAGHFWEEACRSLVKSLPPPEAKVLKELSERDYSGNVRELRAVIFDMVSRFGVQGDDSFKPDYWAIPSTPKDSNRQITFGLILPTLRGATEQLIAEALRRTNGNQTKAARLLGISHQAFSRRLKSTVPNQRANS